MSATANSVSIKKFNSMKEDQGIPLPPPLPPKVGIVKQGIVSILGSDSTERLNKAASIRRTLSADMSSKKWLSQNGFFSPMKKIASSEELIANNDHFSSSFEGDDDHYELIKRPGQDDVWRSIQNNNKNKEPITTSVDVWSSILSQKKEESPTEQLPPPYIHPLVKRSSSLTEKSLEICTESLGSETGSDQSFSSYPPSETETGDVIDEEKEDQQQQQHEEIFSQSFEEVPVVVKYNNKRSSSSSSSVPKSFPPPITSLAREDKPCVHMQSHRQNGRLILEAVSVPPQNLFRAKRHDGRLLLTLITASETEGCDQDVQKVFDDNIEGFEYDETPHLDYDGDDGSEEEECEDDEEEEEEEEKENGTKGMQIVLEQNPRMSNGRMNVNTSTLMMKQLMGLHKKDHWSNNFNLIDDVPQSLPSPTRVSQLIQSTNIPPPSPPPPPPASFNAYEYFWRKNPTVAATILNSPPTKNNNNDKNQVVQAANYSTTLNANSTTKIASYEQQDLVLMRGNNKGNINYLVPLSNGCKEARRSLLIWEPYCIATS